MDDFAQTTEETLKLPPGASTVFRCELEAQPDHLVPQWQLDALPALPTAAELAISPAVRFGDRVGLPATINHAFYQDAWTAWTTDSGTGMTVPFVLGAKSMGELRNFMSGGGLSPAIARPLWHAGILTDKGALERRAMAWSVRTAEARRMYALGFASLRDFIHPFQLSAMRRYYRHQIRIGAFQLGDIQSALRYVVHNDPVARFFHQQLAGPVSEVVGYRLKPSYVYLGAYQPGARLPRHTDRRQCEITMAVCIDFSPEPDKETCWPLQLDTSSSRIGVYQALGDGLIYPGTVIHHLRDVLPDACSSTSLFFHFVSVDYDGPLD